MRFPRISTLVATVVAVTPWASVRAAEGQADGLNPWVTLTGIALVLALGLYLQSTRRRTA